MKMISKHQKKSLKIKGEKNNKIYLKRKSIIKKYKLRRTKTFL